MTTPIDRESVERLAGFLRLDAKELEGLIGVGYRSRLASAPDILLALRAALDAAEAENKRLREALHSIASNTCCDTCQEAALVARAALLGAKPLNERSSEATNWRSQSEEENTNG